MISGDVAKDSGHAISNGETCSQVQQQVHSYQYLAADFQRW